MNVRSVPFVVASLFMFTGAVSAQDWTQNLYTSVGAGYLYQQDATLEETIVSLGTKSATATFNSGFRADVALGYHLNRSWAVEFDTGVLWNSVDQFGGVSMSSSGQTFDTYTVPFLANVIYKIPLKGRLSAYLGGGAGGTASILSYTQSVYDPTDYTFVFAYQAEAGLKYALSQNASFGIAYEFLGTTDPSWQFTETDPVLHASAEYHFKEKGFYTHSLVVSFTWTF